MHGVMTAHEMLFIHFLSVLEGMEERFTYTSIPGRLRPRRLIKRTVDVLPNHRIMYLRMYLCIHAFCLCLHVCLDYVLRDQLSNEVEYAGPSKLF